MSMKLSQNKKSKELKHIIKTEQNKFHKNFHPKTTEEVEEAFCNSGLSTSHYYY